MLFALVPLTQRLAGWGAQGVEGSLCSPNDTVCVEVSKLIGREVHITFGVDGRLVGRGGLSAGAKEGRRHRAVCDTITDGGDALGNFGFTTCPRMRWNSCDARKGNGNVDGWGWGEPNTGLPRSCPMLRCFTICSLLALVPSLTCSPFHDSPSPISLTSPTRTRTGR